ncbi:MAG: protein phosphatase 2C domain-containing protein [Richelia sp.]|nr:protein phosphatase 2C domain-containing protein [Richelia sp.]
MENEGVMLYCPKCQASNPLTHKFCQQCAASLPKRLLWVGGDGSSKIINPGELLADRYFVIEPSILLDTKPGLLPQSPELETVQAIRPYLRLFPYRLHTPQVYGVLKLSSEQSSTELLLLESPPLFAETELRQVKLYSDLINAWGNASAMRQLNWLWQIAQLWQPLASEGVVSSLLTPELIRVEGSLVRLLDLRIENQSPAPSLVDLGTFLQQFISASKPAIANLINQITEDLIQQKIYSPEQLIKILDQGLSMVGRSQITSVTITTRTDTGPRRQRNEDACYPPSGTTIAKPPYNNALAIVCDGIGGHEGGNIASEIAIKTIQQIVSEQTHNPQEKIDPSTGIADLQKAVAIANDKISQQNDSENRQGRQRMGTTLVMGLPIGHEIYIAHVGDSRAYWITPQGCYQVTLDDDVASREVRLGYSLYREAVQQNGAGSLVQALGMSPSSSLHPTAQRFILDDDSVFLLCSDGLSDCDRVEENWETEILPLLTNKLEINEIANKLVKIANNKNGHDNVTVALIHCQVKYSEPEVSVDTTLIDTSPVLITEQQSNLSTVLPEYSSEQKTQVAATDTIPRKKRVDPWQLIIFPLVIVGAVLGFSVQKLLKPSPSPSPQATTGTSTTVPTAIPRNVENLQSGWVIKTTQRTALTEQKFVPANTFLQVIEKKPGVLNSGGIAIRLRICPSSTTTVPETETRFWVNINQLRAAKIKVLQAGETSPCNVVPAPSNNN